MPPISESEEFMYTAIEYELNYVIECLRYVKDIHGHIHRRIDTLLCEMGC